MGLGICSETASIMVILGTHVNFVCVFMISIGVLNLDWASCACVAGHRGAKVVATTGKQIFFNMSHKSLEIIFFRPRFFRVCHMSHFGGV